jgi:uncharacterized protein
VLDLGTRLVDLLRIPGRWWLVILGFWLGFDLLMAAAAVLAGITESPLAFDREALLDPAALAFPLNVMSHLRAG